MSASTTRPAALAALVALLAVGCGEETPTQIVLLVDADATVRERAEELVVTLRGQQGADVTETILVYGDDEPVGFPRPIAVVPRDGDADRSLEAVVDAVETAAESPFVSARLIADFVAGEQILIRVTLTASCIDPPETCSDTETCVDGTCVDARDAWEREPFDESELPCPPGTLESPDGECVPVMSCDSGEAPDEEGLCQPCDASQFCPGGTEPAEQCTQWFVPDRDPATPCPKTIDLTAGQSHACALADSGTVSCWGSTDRGGTTVPELPGTTVQLAAGLWFTCALSDGGEVTCWGNDSDDQTTVPSELASADRIAAGRAHACALLRTGDVECWGAGANGQITVPSLPGTTVDIAAGGDQTCAVNEAGTVTCWGLDDTVPALPSTTVELALGKGSGAVQTCARSDGGTVTCWGNDASGQADVPTLSGTAVAVAAGLRHSCAAHGDDQLTCWGADFDGILNAPALPRSTVELVAGTDFTCARSHLGEVSCWGRNDAPGVVPDPLGTRRSGCDVLAQTGCFEGEACRLADSSGGTQCSEEGTVPVSGVCDETAPCVAGAVCATGGRCLAYCDVTEGDSTCHQADFVLEVGLSYPACDLFEQDCWPGWGCYLGMDATLCFPEGTGTNGGFCDSNADCAAGFLCLVGGGDGTCRQLCDTSTPDTCDSGSCSALDTTGTPFAPDTLGACL
ncbi:MAG: RCC1 domain-containing protein [Myxococcota bacterium]